MAAAVQAHPMVEDALDVVIEPGRVVIDAGISPEQIAVAQLRGAAMPSADRWERLVADHAAYLRDHLHLAADGVAVSASRSAAVEPIAPPAASSLVLYRLEYPLKRPPAAVQISQDFLREFQWTATCVLRVRQSIQPTFEIRMLSADEPASLNCDWPNAPPVAVARASQPVQTDVRILPILRAYAAHGILHILGGYDHLLFVSALVLAASGVWDLVKVVSAFTVAHTLTLTLSVFNVLTVSERIVEPMIAASIVIVAVQNILRPQCGRGRARLAVAFGFGLFHGLGFAGGLRAAMAGLPPITLWSALIAFSAGVEVGHQIVVIPLYGAIHALQHRTPITCRPVLAPHLRQACSILICLAGIYFLSQAIR